MLVVHVPRAAIFPDNITIQEKDGLYQRHRTQRDRDILTLHNKSPQWNEGKYSWAPVILIDSDPVLLFASLVCLAETQSYVLNFNGRVTLASVKNFQIVHDNDRGFHSCAPAMAPTLKSGTDMGVVTSRLHFVAVRTHPRRLVHIGFPVSNVAGDGVWHRLDVVRRQIGL